MELNRRQMLKESFRDLASVLPAVLGVVTGLGALLNPKPGTAAVNKPACFPTHSTKPEMDETQEFCNKE